MGGSLQRTSGKKMKLTSLLSKVQTHISQPSYWKEGALLWVIEDVEFCFYL